MKIHICDQNSIEWYRLRLGVPSASEFHRILTPTGKLSTQAQGYMIRLLAERMIGHPMEEIETSWMARGTELEDSAVSSYEFQNEVETSPVGFITNDAGTVGASPDRMVGTDGLLEIKCPAPNTHVGYLLNKAVESDYYPQLQGQLWISERGWVDICSFHPELPPAVIRVQRDEKYIAELDKALTAFVGVMAQKRMQLESKYGPFPSLDPPKPSEDCGPLGVSDEDVECILGNR